METIYKSAQLLAILFHIFIVFKKYCLYVVNGEKTTFKGWLGVSIQVFLLFFMIEEMNEPIWHSKDWYWFIFDYALAGYFYVTYLENHNGK